MIAEIERTLVGKVVVNDDTVELVRTMALERGLVCEPTVSQDGTDVLLNPVGLRPDHVSD